MSNNSVHIPSLTGIRALAAALVFFGHVLAYHFTELPSIFQYGWIGVNIFFALSGYLFFHLYADSILTNTFSWLDYAKKRFIRIYPLTVVVVIFSSLMLWGTFNIADIFSHIALLHGLSPYFRFSINPPLWSLTVELCFYVLAPILIFMLASTIDNLSGRWKDVSMRKSKLLLAITLISLWIFTVAFTNGASEIYQNWFYYFTGTWDRNASTTTIFGRIDDFVAGMIIAGYARVHRNNTKLNGDIISLIGISIILFVLAFTISQGGSGRVGSHKLSDFNFPLLAIGSSVLFFGMHKGGYIEKFFSSKPLMILGETSFGLYVLHYISFPGNPKSALSLQKFFESLGLHFALSSILNYSIFVLFSFTVYKLYEKPISRLISGYLLKR